ncbi:flagellar brake protein [Ornithinibacillus xuwenensis]|jgi:c-di-GMP-binding flagellar brake protein YcgR|uniref:Flagellar brake domain-containing protein n=1 Tax=Ornithinibacillus xuwenensis TaxID=3144668 RepID=A0ABU9XD24_9BACI
MKIGEFLTLEVFHTETNSVQKYRCKIIDMNKENLYIDYPVNMKTKRTTIFQVGTKLDAEFFGNNQSVYRFKTVIKERRRGKIPTLALEIPDEEKIERIQRRQYVRVDTAIDIAIHSEENKFTPFTTVSVDLSGGGLSIVVPRGVQLAENTKIRLYLVLPMQSGDYQYLHIAGEVVRIIESKNAATTASIKLLSLSKLEQQGIIRYCFEKQREARQKELH